MRLVGLRAWGAKTIMGSSNLTGQDIGAENDPGQAIGIGGYIIVQLNHVLALQPEVIYMQKNFKQHHNYIRKLDTQRFFRVNGQTDWRMHDLSVPLLLKVGSAPIPPGAVVDSTKRKDDFRIHYEFGPLFEFHLSRDLSKEITIYSNYGADDSEIEKQIYPDFGLMTFGLVVGVGGELQLGSGFLTLQSRFMVGMYNTNNTEVDASTVLFTFNIGYGFGIY